jgi:hypothetical protein
MPTTIRCRPRFRSFTSLSMTIISSTDRSEGRLSPCNHVTFERAGANITVISRCSYASCFQSCRELGPGHVSRPSNFFNFLRRGFLRLSFWAHHLRMDSESPSTCAGEAPVFFAVVHYELLTVYLGVLKQTGPAAQPGDSIMFGEHAASIVIAS